MTVIIVNGEQKRTRAERLEGLLVELGLNPLLILVEYNGQALPRSEWEGVRIVTGDKLELLSVAAGG